MFVILFQDCGGCLEAREPVEDCAAVGDEDANGLADCEDLACEAWCTERDCADGDDEDHDELVDCEDEDCWATPECPEVSLTVQSGRGWTQRRERSSSFFWSQADRVWMWSVSGRASLDSGSGLRTCSWTLSSLYMGQVLRYGSTQFSPRVAGLAGCEDWLVQTDFLPASSPRDLEVDGQLGRIRFASGSLVRGQLGSPYVRSGSYLSSWRYYTMSAELTALSGDRWTRLRRP